MKDDEFFGGDGVRTVTSAKLGVAASEVVDDDDDEDDSLTASGGDGVLVLTSSTFTLEYTADDEALSDSLLDIYGSYFPKHESKESKFKKLF